MGLYIDWNDLVSRYSSASTKGGGADEISSSHIIYAENELNGRLAPKFTVPFSSNNLTAKDLSIDLTYLRIGNLNSDNYTKLKDSIDERINRLLAGEENMVDVDGNEIAQSVGGTLYSSTQNYTPTFGFGNTEDFVVDPDLIEDEDASRG